MLTTAEIKGQEAYEIHFATQQALLDAHTTFQATG